jgi:Ca2+-binding RTX toxin-like protein
MVRHGESSC